MGINHIIAPSLRDEVTLSMDSQRLLTIHWKIEKTFSWLCTGYIVNVKCTRKIDRPTLNDYAILSIMICTVNNDYTFTNLYPRSEMRKLKYGVLYSTTIMVDKVHGRSFGHRYLHCMVNRTNAAAHT